MSAVTRASLRPPTPRFWWVAGLVGLFLLFDLGLFAWLIFRSLSQRELDRILLETREEAQDLAGRLNRSAQETGGDLFTAVALEQETQTYIDSVLRQRQIVQTVEITDRNGVLVMKERREAEVSLPAPSLEGSPVDWEQAGGTWWVESWWGVPQGPEGLAEVRRRVEQGPPA